MEIPSPEENLRRMAAGELYYAFTPELVAARKRCSRACARFNNAHEPTRRKQVELWRDSSEALELTPASTHPSITANTRPLPPPQRSEALDDALFEDDPWIEAPIHIDYGTNVHIDPGVFINFNCTILDTCAVTIGARTLIGPNVSLYSGTHPLDPALRNGTKGPELGKEVVIGEDCWIGGNVLVLPGVRLGRGCVVGAGSVVTKSVGDFSVVVGNPAKVVRKIETSMDPAQRQQPELERVSAAGSGNVDAEIPAWGGSGELMVPTASTSTMQSRTMSFTEGGPDAYRGAEQDMAAEADRVGDGSSAKSPQRKPSWTHCGSPGP
ncbi:hypothetical protein LTS18_007142 [Coniosporium uncinatum]|uniref:Uncharacterized protein n=1 Tax=Coniosporium uncinatum TaxID=93489 RepID=A0ACC3D383_9PEZI|nr:hypothetical protein LTS18_007142 [Coniosporium uncinatum]